MIKDINSASVRALKKLEKRVKRLESLLNIGNETGVSDSPSTHGALPLVRKSECEAVATTTVIGEYEHGTLENRIEDGNICVYCHINEREGDLMLCTDCINSYSREKANMKSS